VNLRVLVCIGPATFLLLLLCLFVKLTRHADSTICLRVDGAEFGSKNVTLLFYSEEERTRVLALLTKHTTMKSVVVNAEKGLP
jgi:hypothetical protein